MKILQMLPDFEEGGVERHVLWLSNELARTGHEAAVLSNSGKLVKELKGPIHIDMDIAAKKPPLIIKNAFRIARLLKRERFDMMHVHSRVPAFSAWIASGLSGIPWVYTAHACYSKNLGLAPLRHAHAAICVSRTVSEYLKDYLPARNSVIYNAVPDAGFRWRRHESDIYRFLFVGRLTKVKGIDVLIDAFSALKEFPGWRLGVAGDGPLGDELKLRAEESGISDRVSFLGYRNDIGELMRESDCLLFPSLQEGYGLTLMEGAFAGVPFLASDIPAVRELLPEAQLLPPGSADDWGRALKETCLAKSSPNAGVLSDDPYSIGKMTAEVVKVYQTVLSRRSAPVRSSE